MECRIQYLRPAQIQSRLKQFSAVYVPVAPLEWHAPHLPYGTDPLNAEAAALAACALSGGLVWPTLYFGSERERSPKQLKSLGFPTGSYIVGMDFPRNPLPSMYCPEDVFGVIVRETLREVALTGAKLAVLVNGHGGENHIAAMKRLAIEFSNTTPLRVHLRVAAPDPSKGQISMDHAGAAETSIMMHLCPESVDLKQLPPVSQPLKYADFSIVDGPGFDGYGAPSYSVPATSDPRRSASAKIGKDLLAETARDLADDAKKLLKKK